MMPTTGAAQRNAPDPSITTAASPTHSTPHTSANRTAKPRLELVPDDASQPVAPRLPASAVQRIALSAFEVLEGSRAIAQVASSVTLEVARHLRVRRALRTEQRTLHRDARRIVASPGRPHMTSPREGVVDAVVVLHTPGRAYAVALRFELRARQWRATHLTVL